MEAIKRNNFYDTVGLLKESYLLAMIWKVFEYYFLKIMGGEWSDFNLKEFVENNEKHLITTQPNASYLG